MKSIAIKSPVTINEASLHPTVVGADGTVIFDSGCLPEATADEARRHSCSALYMILNSPADYDILPGHALAASLIALYQKTIGAL